MKQYRIYLDGTDTDYVYDAEDEKDAIDQYKKFCFKVFFDSFGMYPDEDEDGNKDPDYDWINGMQVKAIED